MINFLYDLLTGEYVMLVNKIGKAFFLIAFVYLAGYAIGQFAYYYSH